MRTILWIISAYAIGTIPSPYVIARLAGRVDVIAEMRRTESRGDAHFLVVKRLSGSLGITSIILDIVKGFAPALIAASAGLPPETLAWLGVAAVAGHCFAPFLRHVGGRGLTTAAGVSLVIVPKAMVVAGIIALVGTATRRGGLGTSIGFGLLPLFALAFGYSGTLVAMTAGILALIALRRLEGIDQDRREGIPAGRAVLGRLLFDLPRGGRG